MERGMIVNYHVPCGAGEKLETTSNAYLLQPLVEDRFGCCGSLLILRA